MIFLRLKSKTLFDKYMFYSNFVFVNNILTFLREEQILDIIDRTLDKYKDVELDCAYEIKAYCYYLKYLYQDERIVLVS